MRDMKFLRNGKWAVNLAHVIDINPSANYLVLTTIDGREEKFIYGPDEHLEKLVDAILAFTANDTAHVFDCRAFLENL
jgi:hypothetical protein